MPAAVTGHRGDGPADAADGGRGCRLVTGEATAKTHVSQILSKLGLHSRVQAAILAKDTGHELRYGEG